MADVLTTRALNRALLQRQGLLERQPGSALEWVERLVGLQAQEPPDPYVALWSRVRDFDALELSDALGERRAARAALMRGTIHLVSARDCLGLHPLTQPLLNRIWRSAWEKRLNGAPVDEVVAAGRELLAERPRPRAELQRLLAPRWPQAEPLALAYVVTYMLPLVQITPRGQWRASHQATWALAEDWLGAPLDAGATVDDLVRRYLAAFGPATVSDMRTWCGLNGLRAVFERMRPELRTFADERGRELFDVPDGPLPDPETPAPPRFLGTYDNLLLAHDDRARVQAGLGPGMPWPRGPWVGTLVVDGCYRAFWKIDADGGAATLTVDRFTPHPDDPDDTARAIIEEGERLVAFVAPEAAPSVRFDPAL
jgi:hypothetical protein